MKFFRHGIALLAATLAATQSVAQTQEPELEKDRWYAVELIIFSRTSPSAETSEVWEPLPALNYPGRYRFLQYPELEAMVQNPPSAASPTEIPVQTGSNPVDDVLDPNQIGAVEEDLRPTPFVRLAQDQWEFAQRARRMQQSGRYEILFHERWNQPVVSSERTLPIILDQSGYLQEWPKLQGSIKLYLARYLHLQTNFWVNTMGSYLPGDWQMPPAPLGPGPVPDEQLDDVTQENLVEQDVYVGQGLDVVEPGQSFTDSVEDAYDTGPTYPWRHAVVLRQKRKMRSQEVHYIDHPMMGVIVLVMPITEEELEAMAIEEFGLDPNQPL